MGQEDIRVVCGGVFATLDCKRVELQGGSLFLIDPQSTKELVERSISGFFSPHHPSPALYLSHLQDSPKDAPYLLGEEAKRMITF